MPFTLSDFYALNVPLEKDVTLREDAITALKDIYSGDRGPNIPWLTGIYDGLIERKYKPRFDRDKFDNFRSNLPQKERLGKYPGKIDFYLTILFWLYMEPKEYDDLALRQDCNDAAGRIFLAVWGDPIKTVFENHGISEAQGSPTDIAYQKPDPVTSRLHIEESTGQNRRRYASRVLKVIGRDDEQAKLRQFLLSDEPGFSWLQLAGVGGQGKSRLALALCDWAEEQEEVDIAAGFLNDDGLTALETEWTTWQPTKRTLIVVDYVIGKEKRLGRMMRELSQRKGETLSYPIRLLITERQRWDRTSMAVDQRPREKFEATFSGGDRAEWFIRVTDTYDGHSALLDGRKFDDGIIHLGALGPEKLVSLVEQRVAQISEGKSTVPTPDKINETLTRIDKDGRPLYAYFLAEAIADGKKTGDWSREDLLWDALRRDRHYRWKPAFNERPPTIDEELPCLDLAILATMTKRLTLDAITGRCGFPRIANPTLNQAKAILDQPVADELEMSDDPLLALEPDIIGTYFVLTALKNAENCKERAMRLLDISWFYSPDETAAFLLRAAEDFPEKPVTSVLLNRTPPSEEAISALSSVATNILANLHINGVKMPKPVVDAVAQAALSGNGRAMSHLGACYMHGVGVKADPAQALEWYRKGARANDGLAMSNLGACYQLGTGVKADRERAFEWFQKGADAGEGVAMANLGRCYEYGIGVDADLDKAVEWYRNGADADDGLSMNGLGLCYEHGTGVEADPIMAAVWTRRGAETGDASSMNNLGVYYQNGVGVEADPIQAASWIRKAAKAGYGPAMGNLGTCYQNGIGVEADPEQAVEWYLKGIEAGDGLSMGNLGLCFENGTGVEINPESAVKWYRNGAVAGDEVAMGNLGRCYEFSIGMEVNLEQAFAWYLKGAEAGDDVSMSDLARCYENGIGIEADPKRAVTWYRKAAEAGDELSMCNLGRCYEHGIGVEADLAQAFAWYREGAEAGDGRSMGNLGFCFENGIGVKADSEKAIEWYRKGAKAGDERSKGFLAELQFLGTVLPSKNLISLSDAGFLTNFSDRPWRDEPPFPGEWVDLQSSEFEVYREQIEQSYLKEFSEDSLTRIVFTAARELPLMFYPGVKILDIQYTVDLNSTELMLSVLISDYGALILNGSSARIHAINKKFGFINSDDAALSYLCFYGAFAGDEDGPSKIIWHIDDVPFVQGAAVEKYDAIASQIHSPRHITTPSLREGEFSIQACFLEGDAIWSAIFRLSSSGEFTVRDESLIADSLPIRRRAYRGVARVPLS